MAAEVDADGASAPAPPLKALASSSSAAGSSSEVGPSAAAAALEKPGGGSGPFFRPDAGFQELLRTLGGGGALKMLRQAHSFGTGMEAFAELQQKQEFEADIATVHATAAQLVIYIPF